MCVKYNFLLFYAAHRHSYSMRLSWLFYGCNEASLSFDEAKIIIPKRKGNNNNQMPKV